MKVSGEYQRVSRAKRKRNNIPSFVSLEKNQLIINLSKSQRDNLTILYSILGIDKEENYKQHLQYEYLPLEFTDSTLRVINHFLLLSKRVKQMIAEENEHITFNFFLADLLAIKQMIQTFIDYQKYKIIS